MCSIAKILLSIIIEFLYIASHWLKEIKNWFNYQDFTAAFMKACKIREHGGLCRATIVL